jgi:hypothetical protein
MKSHECHCRICPTNTSFLENRQLPCYFRTHPYADISHDTTVGSMACNCLFYSLAPGRCRPCIAPALPRQIHDYQTFDDPSDASSLVNITAKYIYIYGYSIVLYQSDNNLR